MSYFALNLANFSDQNMKMQNDNNIVVGVSAHYFLATLITYLLLADFADDDRTAALNPLWYKKWR